MNALRLDRIVTLGVVNPVRRASALFPVQARGRAAAERTLPILMYHSISEDRQPSLAPYYRTVTTPRRFAEHMRFLKDRGWRGVSLADGLAALNGSGNEAAVEKLVAVTFDDGFDDFRTAAVPVLRACGFGATMFLPTAYISEDTSPRRFCGRECLNWTEVRRLHAAGVEFGSHTLSHPRLVELRPAEVETEIVLSKSEIESRLGCAITSFSYPFSFPQADAAFCGRLREILGRAGYHACVTTEIGCAVSGDDPYRLRRLPVNDDDDPALLAAKLGGDYNWLAGPQRAYKALRRAMGD